MADCIPLSFEDFLTHQPTDIIRHWLHQPLLLFNIVCGTVQDGTVWTQATVVSATESFLQRRSRNVPDHDRQESRAQERIGSAGSAHEQRTQSSVARDDDSHAGQPTQRVISPPSPQAAGTAARDDGSILGDVGLGPIVWSSSGIFSIDSNDPTLRTLPDAGVHEGIARAFEAQPGPRTIGRGAHSSASPAATKMAYQPPPPIPTLPQHDPYVERKRLVLTSNLANRRLAQQDDNPMQEAESLTQEDESPMREDEDLTQEDESVAREEGTDESKLSAKPTEDSTQEEVTDETKLAENSTQGENATRTGVLRRSSHRTVAAITLDSTLPQENEESKPSAKSVAPQSKKRGKSSTPGTKKKPKGAWH
jgi:hypothetical protein